MVIDKNYYLQNDCCANKNLDYKYLHHPNNQNYQIIYPNLAGIYLFKVSNENVRSMHETYSKFIMKTPKRHHSGVFIDNLKYISEIYLL